MKYLVLILFLCSLTSKSWSQTWTKVGNMPMQGRYYSVGLTYNNKEYMVTGGLTTLSFTDSMWEYTPATNTWKALAPFPGGHRYAAVGFVIGDKAYVGLGEDDISYVLYNDFYAYDFATNTWTRVADFTGGPQYAGATFVLGNKGYIVGGSTGGPPYLNSAYVYDPASNTWSTIQSLPISFGVETLSAFAANGKGYAVGGYVNPGDAQEVLEYDTTTDSWTTLNNIPDSGYAGLSVFHINGKIYMVTGSASYNMNDYANNTSTVFVFDYANNTWTRQPVFPGGGRYAGIGFSIGGIGYVMTGRGNNGMYNDIWKYAPEAGIDNIKSDISLNISPNPTNGDFKVEVNGCNSYTLNVCDVLGRTLISKEINDGSDFKNAGLEIQNKGIYFISVSSNSTYFTTKKLIVQ